MDPINPYTVAHQRLATQLAKAIAPKDVAPNPTPAGQVFTLGGMRWIPVFDPVRGIVLQKAGRRIKVAPGQLGLFAPDTPKEGATKVENGITYRLNANSRWERADKAPVSRKQKLQVIQDEPVTVREARPVDPGFAIPPEPEPRDNLQPQGVGDGTQPTDRDLAIAARRQLLNPEPTLRFRVDDHG